MTRRRHRTPAPAAPDDLEWHVKEMVARMEAQSLPIERIREELRASGIDVEKTIERIAQARAHAKHAPRPPPERPHRGA